MDVSPVEMKDTVSQTHLMDTMSQSQMADMDTFVNENSSRSAESSDAEDELDASWVT